MRTQPVQTYLYYRIADARNEYLGVRYFKVVQERMDSVIQVVVNPGQERKGRGHTFGVYLISRITFFSNYLSMNYAVPCTKKEYDKSFEAVLKYLKA